MDDLKNNMSLELDERVALVYSEFMTRITELEELLSVSNRSLVGFQQQLELLRRPPLHKTSEVVDRIIKANQTERVKAYVQSGYRTLHEGLQMINMLNECQKGLWDHVTKAKHLLHELELLMKGVVDVVQTTNESTSECWDELFGDGLLDQTATFKTEEIDSTHLMKPQISDYVAMMGILYYLIKQDYTMQEKIVSSVSLNSSSRELEGYCQMCSLRPLVDDKIMHQAWKFIKL